MTRLDIVSDVVCPWCYIGKANLEAALAATPGRPFEIRWLPYQLNPDLPPEGRDRRSHLDAKFGGPEAAARIFARTAEAAAAAGLEVDFDRITRSPNTLDAHRLIRWAEADGVQTAVVDELFRRYFRDGDDISDARVLRAAAEAAGMDGAMVARLLDGDADRAAIAAEVARAREIGVSGVPTFILGGRYVVTGAQPPEVWARIIDEIETATVESAS